MTCRIRFLKAALGRAMSKVPRVPLLASPFIHVGVSVSNQIRKDFEALTCLLRAVLIYHTHTHVRTISGSCKSAGREKFHSINCLL